MKLSGRVKFIGRHEHYPGEIDIETSIGLLEEHIGQYVITDGLKIAGGPPCDCGCLNALVYTSKNDAEEILSELKGKNSTNLPYQYFSVVRVNADFLAEYWNGWEVRN